MTDVEDPFAVLGLPTSATADQVRQAWRALASQHHPDKEGGNQVEFMRCRDAYNRALPLAEEPLPCETCQGTGRKEVLHGFIRLSVMCHDCSGSGKRSRQ